MIVVDFLRHGATGAEGRLLGRTDAPLSAAGRRDVAAQTAGGAWQTIVTSPLLRARETADIAAAPAAQAIAIDPSWQEIDFGDWDGRVLADLAGDARFAAFHADPDQAPPPNGEQMSAVRARVAGALADLAESAAGPVLIVAHGGTIRMALSVLLAIPLPRLWAIRIGCATRVSVRMGRSPTHGLWGEIVEIAQPAGRGDAERGTERE